MKELKWKDHVGTTIKENGKTLCHKGNTYIYLRKCFEFLTNHIYTLNVFDGMSLNKYIIGHARFY